MLVLNRQDIRDLVSMRDAIEAMKVAFKELSAGRAQAPLRTAIPVDEQSVSLVMPAFVPAADALGLKVVSVFQRNPQQGLSTISALVCLLDATTGQPAAIMNGAYLTALRTGAVSGAATEYLARKDARHLVVFGPGAQGITQAAAIATVRELTRITVVGRSEASLERFTSEIARDWPSVAELVNTTQDSSVIADADIVCTATTSRHPVFDDRNVQPGTHINAVGSFNPEMQELPSETVARATLVVDQVEAALEEAGDFIIPITDGSLDRKRVSRELGQIVSGEAEGRVADDEITVFKSVGNAVQDVTVARRAVDRAIASGKGLQVSLD